MPDSPPNNLLSPGEPQPPSRPPLSFREQLHEIIFGADTPAGIWFDILLLIAILISVICVCLSTVDSIQARWRDFFVNVEWTLTILFTIEYGLRLYCVQRPLKYATSFFGIVDLLAVLPSYLPLFFSGYQTFAVVRALRLLRVFRILKLGWFVHESEDLARAVIQARAKIVVFVSVILIAITIAGSLMYEIENPESLREAHSQAETLQKDLSLNNASREERVEQLQGLALRLGMTADELADGKSHVASQFSSIPQAMYWATVTMTTVGYGDIVPQTAAGKFVSAVLILLGYSLIIVPTGFVSAEIISQRKPVSNITCRYCLTSGHERDSKFCKHCGEQLSSIDSPAS